jgi:GDP-L-fucose synthase
MILHGAELFQDKFGYTPIFLISINQQYGLDYLHLIPATLYGQNYHTDGRQKHFIFDLINKVSTAKSRNEDVILWGDGYQRRELTHVEDFIENATFFIQNFKNLSLNLGSQRDLSIREYAETISEIIGFDHLAIKYDTNAYTGSTKKLLNSKKAMNLYSDYKIRDLRDSLQKIVIP